MNHMADGVDEDEQDNKKQHWHVTKSIPVAFILTMFLYAVGQTGTIAWYLSRQDSRIDMLEKAQTLMLPQAERLARVEEKVSTVQLGVADMRADIKVILATQDRNKK